MKMVDSQSCIHLAGAVCGVSTQDVRGGVMKALCSMCALELTARRRALYVGSENESPAAHVHSTAGKGRLWRRPFVRGT